MLQASNRYLRISPLCGSHGIDNRRHLGDGISMKMLEALLWDLHTCYQAMANLLTHNQSHKDCL
jgi:hypothetical protein